MFLLVPAYPGCPGQTAVKWLLLFVVVDYLSVVSIAFQMYLANFVHVCTPRPGGVQTGVATCAVADAALAI